jgi:hypothetical protein
MKLKDLETAQANGMWLAYVSYGNDGMASDYAARLAPRQRPVLTAGIY